MSLHTELLRINEIYYKQDLETLTVNHNVIPDSKLIVKDIIGEIFDNAVSISEDAPQNINEELDENIIKLTTSSTGISEDFIDLTRNYKEEFRNILHNLKCRSILEQKTSNPTLEEQITNVIEDIKNLEAAIRKNDLSINIGDTCPTYSNMNLNVISNNNNYISERSGVTDMFKNNTEIKNESQISVEDSSEEIILQVIDLQVPNNQSENYDEMNVDKPTVLYEILEQHRKVSPKKESCVLSTVDLNESECTANDSISEMEDNDKIFADKKKSTKKKTCFGHRVWKFFRNMSKHKTRNTETPIDQL